MLIGSKCERVKRKVGSISIEVGVAKSMDANKCKVQPSRSRTRLVSAERAPSEHARVAVVPCRRHRRPTSTRISTDPASRPLGEPRRDVHAPCKRPRRPCRLLHVPVANDTRAQDKKSKRSTQNGSRCVQLMCCRAQGNLNGL